MDGMVDDLFMQMFADQFGDNWKLVGAVLKIPNSTLEIMRMNNPRDQREVNFQMLKTWAQREGRGATRKALVSKLSKANLNLLASWVEDYDLNQDSSENEVNGSKKDWLKVITEETMRNLRWYYGRRRYYDWRYDDDDEWSIGWHELLGQYVQKQDVQWTTNKFVGGLQSEARDYLYEHFEVPEEDVEHIRSHLLKEESVVNEVNKVLNHGLRVKVQRTRGYLLQKLYEYDENLARSCIEYLIEEMINETNRDKNSRKNGGSRHSSPPRIQSAIKRRRHAHDFLSLSSV